MNNEYIIISKTAIQKRIAELENKRDEYAFNPSRTDDCYRYNSIIKVLKEILSQSTPLIPEIEKAYFEGECYGIGTDACTTKQDYITNLKLDI
jgi:hypothetical protein